MENVNILNSLDEPNLYSDVDDSDNDATYEPGDDITQGQISKREKCTLWNKPSTSKNYFDFKLTSAAVSNKEPDKNDKHFGLKRDYQAPGTKRKPNYPLNESLTKRRKVGFSLGNSSSSDDLLSSEGEEDDPGLPEQSHAPDVEIPPVEGGQTLSRKRESRKKFRREHLWKRTKSHVKRNSGISYEDRNGKIHGARQLRGYPHECKFKCGEHFPEEKRQEIFDDYWKLGNHDLQTSFIFHSVILKEPVRYKSGERLKTRKSFSTEYELSGHRVCKEFFRLTLDESNKRIDNVVKKKASPEASGVSPKDLRGKKEPVNKISEERVNLVKEHINSFPRYVSHYTRAKHPTQKYLCSNLNIRKLIDLYKEFCVEKNVEPVTESFYRYIFNTHFNIKFKKPHTDTCTTCDRLNNLIKHDQGNVSTLKNQLELHLRKAEAAKAAKTEAVKEFENDESTKVICFDLEKTLPTPNLTCSKVFYCRQLWTYNFCVHDLKTKRATMFMWHEGQAGRGCQEIASCLLKYITSLPSTVKRIVAFSDNCGGQNKSALIVRFWSYVVANTEIKSIDHHFFIPGHSFMDCDQDFSVIENAKRKSEREIFVPEDWHRMVAKASRRFMVVHMECTDFVALEGLPLDKYLVKKVKGIQKMMWFRMEKRDPFSLYYKICVNKDLLFSKIDLRAMGTNTEKINHFPDLSLRSGVNPIKALKYKDLQSLMTFIPPCHHDFYKNLKIEKPQKKIAEKKSSARLKNKAVRRHPHGPQVDIATTPSPEEEEVVPEEENVVPGQEEVVEDNEVEADNIFCTDSESE